MFRRFYLGRALGLMGLAALLTAASPPPKKKTWWTFPMPPKTQPSDPMRMFPGFEVPDRPERFQWKIAAPKNDSKITIVPVYDLSGGRLSKIGNVPIGTVVTLDNILLIGKAHFYTLKFKPESGAEKTAWVSGMYIAPSGLASVQ